MFHIQLGIVLEVGVAAVSTPWREVRCDENRETKQRAVSSAI